MASSDRKTIRLTTAQAIVKYLQQQYSERDGQSRRFIPGMFGIFGHGNVAGLGQALYEYGAELTYHQPHNEQAMVHTASGFAKANRRLATLACTASIGPGTTNMVTGAATATVNRLPVLLFPSDHYATRRQGVVLQQLEHPVSADVGVTDCLRPVSRFFDRITRPEQLLTALPEALRVLTDPADTGAVTIALPQDVQAHAYDYPASFFDRRHWRVERRPPDRHGIREAVTLLEAARRPVMIAGGGVHYSDAQEELQALAQGCGIPVSETFAGKGAIRDEKALLLGGQGVTGTGAAGNITGQADLVIMVGTRLQDFLTGSQSVFANPEVKFISINVCGHDAYKQGALPIVADAREALRMLAEAAELAGIRPDPVYRQEIAAAKAAWCKQVQEAVDHESDDEAMSQGRLIRALNQAAQAGDTVIGAAGTPPADLLKMWDATGGRNCHIEFGYSCMGYEIPAGIGVRMAQPDGEVYVFIGDGTYLMNPTEIATSVQEDLKITVVISENHGFQSIWQLQDGRAGRDFGNEFRHRDTGTNRLSGEYVALDLAQNAASMGARAWHVQTPDALEEALAEVRDTPRTCVIVAETEPHRYLPGSDVWWDIAPAEVSGDPVTQALRGAYEQERESLQRFYY